MKKEYPLVLLHVTLLPIPTPYSRAVLERVLPASILENWKLLREKITPTVLERGILIPHPREDYDLLEERLLESLELRMPRILACGHFHLSEEEEAELAEAAEEERRLQDEEGEEGANDADICADCGRRVRDGRYGTGAGSRRWDIKLYAANGLMRAGAWSAAWREMERVDVEVCPFVNEELKRELEIAREHEETEEAVRRAEEALCDAPIVEEETGSSEGRQGESIDEARMREIYGDDAQDYIDGLHSSPSPSVPSTSSPRPTSSSAYPPTPHQRPRTPAHELPLSTLLRNYIVLLSRDPRNLAIALLSLLVLLLAMASRSSPAAAPALYQPDLIPTAASQVNSGVSSSLLTSPAPIINTGNPEPAISATYAVSKTQAKKEADSEAYSANSDRSGDAVAGEEDKDTEEMIKGKDTDTDTKIKEGEGEQQERESTTEKVLKAVDGVLDMVGGGGDEIAE